MLLKSSKVDKIYCAPGNAGIGQIAECVDIYSNGIWQTGCFCQRKIRLILTIIGMDDPLVGGMVDVFEEHVDFVYSAREKCSHHRRIQSVFQRS
ncbi:MAG: phosphoribosylamine--glycine ligase [Clostridium sp.]